jgi:hypothetical protein
MSIRSIALEIASNEKKKHESKFKDVKDKLIFWQETFERTKG